MRAIRSSRAASHSMSQKPWNFSAGWSVKKNKRPDLVKDSRDGIRVGKWRTALGGGAPTCTAPLFGYLVTEYLALQTFEKGRGDRSDQSRGTKRGGTTSRCASSVDGVVDTGDPGHQGRSGTLADRPSRPRHVRRVCRPSIAGDRRSRPEVQGRNDQTSLGALDQDHLCQRRRRASGDRRPRDLLPDGRGCARPDPVRECRG